MTTQSLATPVEAPHDVMPVHGIDHLQVAGAAARRLETKPGRDFFSSVFRFTIEFGVVYESDPATPTPNTELRRRHARAPRRCRCSG